MSAEGPLLDRLTHRLSECPGEFLEPPRIGDRGMIHVDAVVADLMTDLGGPAVGANRLGAFRARSKQQFNRLRLILVACWLLHDESLRADGRHAQRAMDWLSGGLDTLARQVSADRFTSDPDRREELARLCLDALGLRPQGETEKQAADRLKTLDSVERAKVLADIKAAEERARKLREAMERKRAQEAASRYTRE